MSRATGPAGDESVQGVLSAHTLPRVRSHSQPATVQRDTPPPSLTTYVGSRIGRTYGSLRVQKRVRTVGIGDDGEEEDRRRYRRRWTYMDVDVDVNAGTSGEVNEMEVERDDGGEGGAGMEMEKKVGSQLEAVGSERKEKEGRRREVEKVEKEFAQGRGRGEDVPVSHAAKDDNATTKAATSVQLKERERGGVKRGTIDSYFMRLPKRTPSSAEKLGESELDGGDKQATSKEVTSIDTGVVITTTEHIGSSTPATNTAHISVPTAQPTQRRIPSPDPGSRSPSPSPSASSSSPQLPSLSTYRRHHRSRKRRTPAPPPTKKLTQLHIDLGGSPIRQTCKQCHMSYIPGSVEDESLHRRFHNQSVGGIDFPLPTATAAGLPEGVSIVWRDTQPTGGGDGGGMVVMITIACKNSVRRRVAEVMDVVSQELGSDGVDIWGDGGGGGWGLSSRKARPSASSGGGGGERYTVYLYLLGKKCVGMCLAERIHKAYKVLDQSFPSSSSFPPSDTPVSSSSHSITTSHLPAPMQHQQQLILSSHPHPAHLGISRIWVCASFRKRGYATQLLECARRSFIYGMCVEVDKVAFSQPTQMGEGLARRWAGKFGGEGGGWAVYVEE